MYNINCNAEMEKARNMGYTKYRTIRNQQKTLKLELAIRLKLERFGVCLIVLCRGWVCGGRGGGLVL